MIFLKRFSSKIEEQEWDHLRYLQLITLVLVLFVLLMYLWLLLMARSFTDTYLPEFLRVSVRDLSLGLLIGIISGIVAAFMELIKKYVSKEWDLHVVVPYFLKVHLLLSLILLLVSFLTDLPAFIEQGFIIGFNIGGLIGIVAYAGEVKREHTEKQD